MNTIILPLSREQADALTRALALAHVHCADQDDRAIAILMAKIAAAVAAAT